MSKRIMDGFDAIPDEIPVNTSAPEAAETIRRNIRNVFDPVRAGAVEIGSGMTLGEQVAASRSDFLNRRTSVSPITSDEAHTDTARMMDERTRTIVTPSGGRLLPTSDRLAIIRAAVETLNADLNATRTGDLRGVDTTDKPTAPFTSSDYNPNAPESRDQEPPQSLLTAVDPAKLADALNVVERGLKRDPKTVKISPFRFTVWRRHTPGQLTQSLSSGQMNDVQVPRGRYVLTFSGVRSAGLPAFGLDEPFTVSVAGKQQLIEKIVVNPAEDKAYIQVQVTENLIPLLVLSTVALGAAGWTFWKASDALDSFDKVIVDTTGGLMPLLVIGGVGLAVWFFWPKLKAQSGG